MNICADCKHSQGKGDYMKCAHPNNMVISFVTGESSMDIPHCLVQRMGMGGEPRLCGEEGRWFEPKPVKTSWWSL